MYIFKTCPSSQKQNLTICFEYWKIVSFIIFTDHTVMCSKTHAALSVIYCVLHNPPWFCNPPPFLTYLWETHVKIHTWYSMLLQLYQRTWLLMSGISPNLLNTVSDWGTIKILFCLSFEHTSFFNTQLIMRKGLYCHRHFWVQLPTKGH